MMLGMSVDNTTCIHHTYTLSVSKVYYVLSFVNNKFIVSEFYLVYFNHVIPFVSIQQSYSSVA